MTNSVLIQTKLFIVDMESICGNVVTIVTYGFGDITTTTTAISKPARASETRHSKHMQDSASLFCFHRNDDGVVMTTGNRRTQSSPNENGEKIYFR